MQPLTKVMQGATCTVKWALGLPETVEKLRELKIEQGSKLQVVCKKQRLYDHRRWIKTVCCWE